MSGNVLLTIQDRFANTRVTPIATPFLFWLQRVWCRIPCPKELRGARRLTFPTGRTTEGKKEVTSPGGSVNLSTGKRALTTSDWTVVTGKVSLNLVLERD